MGDAGSVMAADSGSSALQERAANLQQVTDTDLAITVLIQHCVQQAATQATLLLHLGTFLTQHATQAAGVHAAGHHAAGQEGHHDRRQDLEQLAGLAGAHAADLAQASFGARLGATKDMAQDAAAIQLATGRLATAEHGTEQATQIQTAGRRTAHVVALQRIEQAVSTLLRLGILAQGTHDHRNRCRNGIAGLGRAGTQLAGDLAQAVALQLLQQVIDDGVADGGFLAKDRKIP